MPRSGLKQPIDVSVGSVIRINRVAKGWSQTRLAESLGITFQQVQKYEKGTNRVGASRLHKLAEVLGLQILDFFPGLDTDGSPIVAAPVDPTVAFVSTQDGMQLNRAFINIEDPKVRQRLIDLVRVLGGQ